MISLGFPQNGIKYLSQMVCKENNILLLLGWISIEPPPECLNTFPLSKYGAKKQRQNLGEESDAAGAAHRQ